MASKCVLVTGATGRQGRLLIASLLPTPPLESGANTAPGEPTFHILALTRKPTSPVAKQLSLEKNVTVVEGNLDFADSIRKIFEGAKAQGGIWGVFCVLAFPGLGANADGEENQGKVLADISVEYGVSSFVFSSVERGGESHDDKLVLDRLAKVRIERHIRELGHKGLRWTILRPGFFMENYEGAIGSITASVLKVGLKPTTTIQLIAVDDIGHVAAGVFKDPQSFISKILVVVGDVLTMKDQNDTYQKATGRSMPSTPGFVAKTLLAINGHTQGLIADIERVHRMRNDGECADEDAQMALTRLAYPDMTTFESWAAQRGKKSPERANKWNRVTIPRLVSGKQ